MKYEILAGVRNANNVKVLEETVGRKATNSYPHGKTYDIKFQFSTQEEAIQFSGKLKDQKKVKLVGLIYIVQIKDD